MEISSAFLDAIRQQLRGDESPREIERLLAGLPPEVVEGVLRQLCPAAPPPLETPSSASLRLSGVSPPRLIVDWGSYPEVGHQARPHFMLLCPEPYASQPDIKVTIDRELDHEAEDQRPYPEDDRLWGFHIPFRLTTRGQDCRPGQYLIEVRVSFPDLAAPGVQRCFRCAVRLKIQSPGSGRTLEIDGDGQSIVNLQGHDLTGFSRVVLKGSDTGIINLHNLAGPAKPAAGPAPPSEAVVHEYSLKLDPERERLLPRLSAAFTRRDPMAAATLAFSSGRRMVVVTRRQVKLGRNRDNDIVLRFLPRSDLHDRCSKAISRTHFVMELVEQGLRLQDTSSTGVSVGGKAVPGEMTISPDKAGQAVPVVVGTAPEVEKALDLEACLLRVDERSGPPSTPDELIARALGEPVPALWRLAKAARIDAVRLRRKGNLPEEEYLLLFRETLLRPSKDSPVVTLGGTQFESSSARLRHLGGVFWLENIGGQGAVRIDGQPLAPRELVPLAAGMAITLGPETLRFERAEQLGLGSAL